MKARFERACQNEVALSGSGVTQATLVACASALELSACELPFGPPPACDFRGAVPGGGPCTDAVQCASGACRDQQGFSPDGPITPMKCGTCAPLVGLGEVCGSGNFTAGCDPSAICLSDPTADAGSPTYRCTPVARGAVGASCDGLTSGCALGLYCAAQTGQCAALGSSGAPCGEGKPPAYPGGCVAPLACIGPQGSSTCGISSTGAPCAYALDCSASLSCVTASSPSGKCASVTWASPQEPCDGDSVLCLVGSCPVFGSRACPAVIPDGQPCSPSDTCDTFSDCFDVGSTADSGFDAAGTCVLHDSTACH